MVPFTHDSQSEGRGARVKFNSTHGFPGLPGPENWPLVRKPTNSSALSIHRDRASPGSPWEVLAIRPGPPRNKRMGCEPSIVKGELGEGD